MHRILIFILFFFIAAELTLAEPQIRVYPECFVWRVVDGDTIHCLYQGQDHYIRFRAVDTPEIFFGKNECFSGPARDYLESKIYGKYVKVEIDGREKGGAKRELGYIWYKDEMLNLTLILRGYGVSVVDKYPTVLYNPVLFSEAENLARSQNLGLWRACKK